MAEETSQPKEEAVQSKPKVIIPTWAIKKVRDDQFSVFIEKGGVKVFLGKATSAKQAEALYLEKA